MSEIAMLRGAEPKQILQTAVEKRVPAIMTYLSKGKWHVAKVFLTDLGPDRLNIDGTHSGDKPQPINIRVHQPVGISFKYGYGKFVFDTTVVALEPSLDAAGRGRGGTIVLALPDRIEVVQRRSYFRVSVPESLKVNVLLWHRSRDEAESTIRDSTRLSEGASRSGRFEARDSFQGRLVDISAGGAQIVIPHQSEAKSVVAQDSPTFACVPMPAATQRVQADKCGDTGRDDFKKGQFVGVRLTPMPYETPLMFNAQIRNVLPAADDKSIYLGLQIVGLEASSEGRKVLSRLVGVVERYFKINQSSAKQQDMQRALSVS